MGATTYWLLQVTPLYTADVLIVIEPRPSSIVKVEEAVQDVSSDTAKVNTEVAILESRGLAARVIRHLELEDDPEFLEEDSEVARGAIERVARGRYRHGRCRGGRRHSAWGRGFR